MLLRHALTCFVAILAWMGSIAFVAIPGSPFLAGPMVIASGLVLLAAFFPSPKRSWTLKDLMISIVICGIFSGGLAGLRDSPSTRYNVAYHSIRIGMTLAEVEETVRRERDFRPISCGSSLDDGYVRFAPAERPDDVDDCINIFMQSGRVAEICPIPD